MLRLDASRRAQEFLERLPTKHKRQVVTKLANLLIDPRPPDSKLLQGYGYRRVDVGEYRIIYSVEGNTVRVPLVGKRNDAEVYRQLARLI